MDGMTLIAIIVAGLALLGVAATTVGVDSRGVVPGPSGPAQPFGHF